MSEPSTSEKSVPSAPVSTSPSSKSENGLIAWWVKNPIAANLLMLMILVGGLTSLPGLEKEMFPQIDRNMVQVLVPYPGAGPREVEEQICVRVEEAIHDLNGIDEIRSFANQGSGRIEVDVADGYDTQKLLNDIKSRVDAINTFPADSERAEVKEVLARTRILSIALAGSLNEWDLKRLAESIRDDVIRLPGVTLAEISGVRSEEVSIELTEQALRKYQLKFDDVVAAIRRSSINLPAGEVREASGDIVIQTRGQAYHRSDFENIVVLRDGNGTEVTLGQLATVKDGFVEQDKRSEFNGRPAVFIRLYNSRNPDITATSEAVRAYVKEKNTQLQGDVELVVWADLSVYLQGRIDLLLKNAVGGLLLVFLLLMLFLRPALAFWVSAGIGISYVGTLWLMPVFGISINVVSLFAFLLILGIVVDDAIVVGESIHAANERGMNGMQSAIRGTSAVGGPVTFAVLTTIIVFIPMLLLSDNASKMMVEMPKVAILALCFSLLESFFILPAHLRHLKPEQPPQWMLFRFFHRIRTATSNGLKQCGERFYAPVLRAALRHSATTLAIFLAVLIVVLGIYFTGWLRMMFFPVVEGEYLLSTIELREGAPFHEVEDYRLRMQKAIHGLNDEAQMRAADGSPLIKNYLTEGNENTVVAVLELVSNESREMSSRQVAELWRKHIGVIENVERFEINYTLMPKPKDIELQIKGDDMSRLRQATAEVERELATFRGVHNISDSLRAKRMELEMSLKPNANTLGVGLDEVAKQLRYAFYGYEVQRIPRLKEDVKVMVRYSAAERAQMSAIDELRVRTNDGRELPFSAVAEATFVPGYTEIKRLDRQRVVEIEAELYRGGSTAYEITQALLQSRWPAIAEKYPEMSLVVSGAQKDQEEFESTFVQMMVLALLAIYACLAIQLHSYWQPVIILSAVPFGIAGAIIGHLVFGKDISMPSMLGVMAATGVVVNDNLVLIDRINQLRDQGAKTFQCVWQGAKDRFRPIVLTSLTTCFGLLPILFERSSQAQFLIPMVISLAFGVLLASFVTLILVPVLYQVGEYVQGRK